MSIQEKVLMRKIKKREKQKLKLVQKKEKDKVEQAIQEKDSVMETLPKNGLKRECTTNSALQPPRSMLILNQKQNGNN